MPTLEFTTDLPASLAAAWAFHLDVTQALPLLSPPDSDVRIVSADLPARVGQRVQMNVRGPLGVRLPWVARIVEFSPPSEVSKDRASFVDVQEKGPFGDWRHEHLFTANLEGICRLTDRVTYRAPFGPLGWLADQLFLSRQLRDMFAHRHRVTREYLSKKPENP